MRERRIGSSRSSVCAIAVIVWTVSSLLHLVAQQAPSRPIFRSNVNVVPLDVTVLDAHRQPIRGLTAADFRVVADGEDRSIVAFEAIELPDRVRTGARWLQEVTPDVTANGFNPDRIVVLLLDDWNTASQAWGAVAMRKIGHAILDELGPSDLAAVVYPFQTQRGADFTTDRARLRTAVDAFSVGRPSNLGGPSGVCPEQSCVLGAMRAISQAAQTWPDRRKLLVYVSPEGNFSPGSNMKPDSADGNGELVGILPELLDTIRELQRANVTVYQFDPRGLEEVMPGINASKSTAGTAVGARRIGGNIGMFADQTAGWSVTRSNAPWLRAPQMFVENDSYYMLGFTPSTHPSRTGFHPIRVIVNRPGVVVTARRNYSDPEPKSAAAASTSQAPQLEQAMLGLVPVADLPLSLTVAPFRAATSQRAAVAVVGGFDGPAEQAGVEVVDVAVRAFDERSQLRESKWLSTSTLRLRAQRSSAGGVHYDAVARLDLPPGHYEVRLSMQRASDQVKGGVARFLTVPNFQKGPISLSGVVLGRLSDTASPSDDPFSGVLPFTPTTVRSFAVGDSVTALVQVYQGGRSALQPTSVTARIVDAQDEQVFDLTSEITPQAFSGPARSAAYQVKLPLSTLSSGEYLLRIEGTLGKHTVQATPVRFRVD